MNKALKEELELLRLESRALQLKLLISQASHRKNNSNIDNMLETIPANSLACLYGLALECREQRIFGDNVEFEIHAFDETNTHIDPARIAELIKRADDGIVMLVGVQSNWFPRALDIARPLRDCRIKVAVGGFHVSGTMAMLQVRDPFVQAAIDLGVTVFAGEAEGRLAQVLIDAAEGKLAEVYDFMDDLPNIENVATPLLPADRVHLTAGAHWSDAKSHDSRRRHPHPQQRRGSQSARTDDQHPQLRTLRGKTADPLPAASDP